jgi:hypothetical protein
MLLQQNIQAQDLLEEVSNENFTGRFVCYSTSSVCWRNGGKKGGGGRQMQICERTLERTLERTRRCASAQQIQKIKIE